MKRRQQISKKVICPFCKKQGVEEKYRTTSVNIHEEPIILVTFKHGCKEFKKTKLNGWTHSYPLDLTTKIN